MYFQRSTSSTSIIIITITIIIIVITTIISISIITIIIIIIIIVIKVLRLIIIHAVVPRVRGTTPHVIKYGKMTTPEVPRLVTTMRTAHLVEPEPAAFEARLAVTANLYWVNRGYDVVNRGYDVNRSSGGDTYVIGISRCVRFVNVVLVDRVVVALWNNDGRFVGQGGYGGLGKSSR
jgi:hypothetical protein